jgi:RNA polymerase sigma-70 factor (ECF subfamily)
MFSPTDGELARRALQGEPQAFGELVKRYQSSVFNVCYRMVGERTQAEDLAQEAFIRAYRRLDQYDGERPFGPWIRRLSANLCLNHLQSEAARQRLRSGDLAFDDETTGRIAASGANDPVFNITAAPGYSLATGTSSPEALQEQAELSSIVRAAIASLPVAYRAVIELRHFQDLSYAEIAEQLGIPLSDVKSHLFRARQMLAEKLKPYG